MLSFIVPVYNKERIIEKCIKSLVAQSLKDWEAIFVLDGPQETTKEIINREMKKSGNNFKVIEQDHAGACRARNRGFEESKGEYVVFWDADCVIEPETSNAWVEILSRDKDIGFVYSDYKFLNEMGALPSLPFDPWLLRVRNYISACFPVRRDLVAPWNESLESLQDWDFWLSVVENGGKGKYLKGYGWSTLYPDVDSISGKGCTDAVWLDRVRAVQKLHNIKENEICVAAPEYRADGIMLAKMIGADYQDFPNFKPNSYKKIVQIGFNMNPALVESYSNNLSNPAHKKFLFWTGDNMAQIYQQVSVDAMLKYKTLLNDITTQFVEDKRAKDTMAILGFNVTIMPLPLQGKEDIAEFPKKPKFAVDITGDYGKVFNSLEISLPDIELQRLSGNHKVSDFTGLLHFYPDRSMSSSIKRMLLSGRHVISNVQSPFAGYVDDLQKPDTFLPEIVEKIREVVKSGQNVKAKEYYENMLGPSQLMEVLS